MPKYPLGKASVIPHGLSTKETSRKGGFLMCGFYLYPPTSSSRTSLARSHIHRICLLTRSVAPPLRKKTSLTLWIFCGLRLAAKGCAFDNCISQPLLCPFHRARFTISPCDLRDSAGIYRLSTCRLQQKPPEGGFCVVGVFIAPTAYRDIIPSASALLFRR